MSLASRLTALEHQTPRGCATCATWTLRVAVPDETPNLYELAAHLLGMEADS